MFYIEASIKYGWEKFKTNLNLCLTSTLFMLALGSLGEITNKNKGVGILSLALIVLLIIIRIGYAKIFLRIHDGESPKFTDLFTEYKTFWRYLGVSVLTGLAVIGGLLLLIIPGLIWAVRFSFAPVIVIDTKSGPIVSMKESYAITNGYFWKLLLFWLTIIILNVLGLLVFVVGLLVTVPVSALATIYVYRILTQIKAGMITETPSPQTA